MTDSETTEEAERTEEPTDDGGEPADERPDAAADPDADRPRGDGAGAPAAGTTGGSRLSSVRKTLYWALLAGLVLFGGMMVLLVYSDFRTLINVFVAREYQLLIQVAFHVVVLLCAAIGVSLLVRRLEELPG